MDRITEIERKMRSTVKVARGMLDAAKSANRGLTESEEATIRSYLANVEELRQERDSLLAGKADADAIRAKVGSATAASGWKTVATEFVKAREAGHRDHVMDLRLIALHKGASVSDLLAESVRSESGIRPLLEDKRSFASMLRSQDPGNALHLEHFAVTARSLASGTVERDPMSTSAKAVADVTVEQDSVDLRQFAITSGAIPNAALRSVPALQGVLQAALGRELDQALDNHARAALDASTPAAVSGGSDIIGELRHAKQDLIDLGVEGPYLAVIGRAGAISIDLTLGDDMPPAFPFGLNIAVMTNLGAGQGYVLSQSAMTLWKGGARLDADLFSGFGANTTNFRLEFEALAVVDEPSAIISLGGVSFTT